MMREQQHFGKVYWPALWLTGLGFFMIAAGAFAAVPATIAGGWIRLLPGDVPLAGYFTLHNNSKQPMKLVGASSPAFKRIELHRSMEVHGMDKMVPVKRLRVGPGGAVQFAPGGYHLMMWRSGSLKIGARVPVTLIFVGGRHVKAAFIVAGPAGKSS